MKELPIFVSDDEMMIAEIWADRMFSKIAPSNKHEINEKLAEAINAVIDNDPLYSMSNLMKDFYEWFEVIKYEYKVIEHDGIKVRV